MANPDDINGDGVVRAQGESKVWRTEFKKDGKGISGKIINGLVGGRTDVEYSFTANETGKGYDNVLSTTQDAIDDVTKKRGPASTVKPTSIQKMVDYTEWPKE